MIQDQLINAVRYHALHSLFAQAFAWLADPRSVTLPDGRHQLRGDDLIAILESGTTMPSADKRLESHRRYIDIQAPLTAAEIMEWAPSAGLAVLDDFKPDGDIRFHAQPAGVTRLLVRPGEFAVFHPEDAHKPCCHPDGAPVPFRKAVLKVAVRTTGSR